MPPSKKLPTVKQSSIVLDTFFKVRKDKLSLNELTSYDYYTVETKADAVCMIAITKEGLFLTNKEYRHPVQQMILGFPGGYIDHNEQVLEAASRELLEETGYKSDSPILIGLAYPYAGISHQKIYFVAAFNAYKHTEPNVELMEILETELMSRETIEEYINSEKPVDGILCSALFYLDRFKKQDFQARLF